VQREDSLTITRDTREGISQKGTQGNWKGSAEKWTFNDYDNRYQPWSPPHAHKLGVLKKAPVDKRVGEPTATVGFEIRKKRGRGERVGCVDFLKV